jgi:hypothetical protein
VASVFLDSRFKGRVQKKTYFAKIRFASGFIRLSGRCVFLSDCRLSDSVRKSRWQFNYMCGWLWVGQSAVGQNPLTPLTCQKAVSRSSFPLEGYLRPLCPRIWKNVQKIWPTWYSTWLKCHPDIFFKILKLDNIKTERQTLFFVERVLAVLTK